MSSPRRFAIPYRLDFAPDGSGRHVMGRGAAGWTVADFTDPREALAFAKTVPEMAYMPATPRAIEEIREAVLSLYSAAADRELVRRYGVTLNDAGVGTHDLEAAIATNMEPEAFAYWWATKYDLDEIAR